MKKVCLLALFALFSATVASAQAPLGKGGAQFNAGVGLSNWGTPIYLGFDFGVHPDITIGPMISFRNYSYNAGGSKWDQNLTVLGFNGNYHFNTLLSMPSKWDFYAGATLGYFIWSSSEYTSARGSGIGLNGQIGGRYFFTNKFGINLELGGGTATGGNLGITYKLK